MDLKDYIAKKKDLSEGSIKTYFYSLRALHKKVFGDKPIEIHDFDSEKVYDFVKEHNPKVTVAALYFITDNPMYNELMKDNIKKQLAETAKQLKTEKQETNWLETDEINKIYDKLEKQVPHLYKAGDLQEVQQFILLSLLGGKFIEPRRAKDYFDFKIKNIDKDKDNYLEKGILHFNSFKTAKSHGHETITVPKPLMTILRKWIKTNPTDYLLFDRNGNQLTAVTVNQRLNKLFGKQASINMLRHTYLQGKFGDDIDKVKDIKQTFKNMGSSINMFENYVKH
jgi:integrase